MMRQGLWKKRVRQCAFLSVFCLSGMIASQALAEPQAIAEVVVVATPIIEGNEVSRYGGQTTKVSEQQIHDMNAQDIASALRRVPGVTISRYNQVGSFGGAQGGGIFIRGSGTSRPGGDMQMLYDGVPRMMGVFNHPLLDIISIDPASSVQVYKSPQPQAFGNGQTAVNIETKRMRKEGFTTTMGAQYGSFNTFMENVEHGGKVGAVDYYIGQSYKSSDGHREHSGGNLQSYFARLGSELGENWNISWFGNYTDNKAQDPGHRDMGGSNNGTYNVKDVMNIVTLEHEYKKASGFIKGYYNEGEVDWDGELAGIVGGKQTYYWTDIDWDMYGVRAQEKLHLWQGGEVITGFDIDTVSGKMRNTKDGRTTNAEFNRETLTTYSAYAALSQLFGDRDSWYAIPSAGVRQYWHSEFDAESSPHAGFVLGYKDTELHLGYARGVVYPGLNVAIQSSGAAGPPTIPMFNPDGWKKLSPETIEHYEIGLSHTFTESVNVDITAFWDQGHDRYRMISGRLPNGRNGVTGFDNIQSYKRNGIEATINWAPLDELSFFVGATWLEVSPGTMPYSPEWSISTGMVWRFMDDFQLSADMLFRDKMYVDAWARSAVDVANPDRVDSSWLVNAKLSYFFEAPELYLDKGEVFVAVENLTNASYEYSPGYTMPGTSVMVGFSLSF